jgi:hypothetical protein
MSAAADAFGILADPQADFDDKNARSNGAPRVRLDP